MYCYYWLFFVVVVFVLGTESVVGVLELLVVIEVVLKFGIVVVVVNIFRKFGVWIVMLLRVVIMFIWVLKRYIIWVLCIVCDKFYVISCSL